MPSILVSACLLGQAVRYDGSAKKCSHPLMQRWLDEGRVMSICHEISAGLPVPRPATEIAQGAGGAKVLTGEARVVGAQGQDYSAEFVAGARYALTLAQRRHIRVAVLKEGSPSCGSSFTHDGSFSAARVPHAGVTATLLRQSGIHVFSENQLEQANDLLLQLEAQAAALPAPELS
jgi:uncharacterized protein YbbK (DUF523 family)